MSNWLWSVITIIGTLSVYIAALKVYRRFHSPFTLPILTSTLTIILFLLVTNVSYDTYMTGGRFIEHLLGPAVVALAYPLYNQRHMVRKNFLNVTVGVTVGGIIGISTGGYLAKWVGVDQELVASMVPKSVTTPIAMDLSLSIHGIPELTVVLVMVAGTGGAVLSPYVYKWCKIDHALARGIGLGNASHGIGTAKAIENSEEEGAASSIAMTMSAVIVSILIPLLYPLMS